MGSVDLHKIFLRPLHVSIMITPARHGPEEKRCNIKRKEEEGELRASE